MVSVGRSSSFAQRIVGCALIAALAGCQQNSLSPGSSADSATAATIPVITLELNPSSVAVGKATTLKWNSTAAHSCTASGGWSGPQATSGTMSTDPLTSTTSFTLTCTGAGGSVAQSAQAIVAESAPSVTLAASPTTVSSGSGSNLTWNSTDATECTAAGGWQGIVPTSGTWPTGALSNTTEYAITCTGPKGSATQSATVTVTPADPTVAVKLNPSTVNSGSPTTIAWFTSNVTSCIASGAWSGPEPLSGSQSTGPITANSTYTLTCTGFGASATQSATVSVKPAAPTVSLSANPSTVVSGTSSTLKWSAANATSCSASGAWSGSLPVSGSQSTGVLTANSSYTLTCTGPGGTAAQSATVTVKSAAPTVILSVGPSAITSGLSSTLTWSAANASACAASGAWSGSKPASGSQSTGTLKASATYTLTCSGAGGSASQSATVTVSAHPSATVSFSASPSTIASGRSATLNWSSTQATSCSAGGGWSGAKPLSGSQSTGVLTGNTTYTLTCTGAVGSATQFVTVSVTPPAPTISLSASPSTIASGASSTLNWSSTNATSCSASGAWSGAMAVSGTRSSGALKSDETYTLTCSGAGGSAVQSATVSVTQSAPTVSFTASPSTVKSGAGSTLTWSAANATACTASGAWSGSKAVSGSQPTGALTSDETYILTCSGAGGSAVQQATVSVTAPAPAVTLAASPNTLKSGATSTLTWSSTHATSCTASGGWSGSEAPNGSKSTAALTATTQFVLACSGPGGTASQTTTVTVSAKEPTVTLSASPTSVSAGGSSTLTWVSTNATACTASGGWSGSLAISGSRSTGALSASTTYTLSCSGAGGVSAQSATVTVAPATTAGTVSLSWTAPTANTDGSPVTLSGYTIYYGTSASALTESVVISGASNTSYEVSGLASGTWYFAVAADAADGQVSAPSLVGSKTL
jgi:trimeric autotransporter adhesin